MYVCVVVEGCCYLMKWYVVGGHMMLHFVQCTVCTVTKYDVESCTKMLQVVVGCSELQWDVNCHCMLLHDIKYCCHLAYATGWL